MSAFIVSDSTVNNIINTALKCAGREGFKVHHGGNVYHFTWETAHEAVQYLMNENYRSVNFRYSESNQPHLVNYKRDMTFKVDRAKEIAAAFKSADCLDYQSCETDDWEQTLAYEILARCRYQWWHALPGYEDAAWD